MTIVRLAGTVVLGLALSGPAWPGPEAEVEPCGAVLAALRGLGAAPQFHWSMSATTPTRRFPRTREQIALNDEVFLTPDEGRWMRARVPISERKAKMEEELAQAPPATCHHEGSETRGGRPMHIIGYSQGEKAKRIWIGDADGLPYYFTSSEPPVSVTMQVDYTGVRSPLRP